MTYTPPYETYLRQVFERHQDFRYMYSADQVASASKSKPAAFGPCFHWVLKEPHFRADFNLDNTILAPVVRDHVSVESVI